MCFLKKEPAKPEITILSESGTIAARELVARGYKLLYPVLMDGDAPYYYTDSTGWAEVMDYVYLKYPMPGYVAGRMDCEDFALHLKGLVSALFGLNWFAFVLGNVPGGYHGFNMFKTESGLLIMEPQTNEYWEPGERQYIPEYVLM